MTTTHGHLPEKCNPNASIYLSPSDIQVAIDQVQPDLGIEHVSIAAVNGPFETAISGHKFQQHMR